MALINFIKHLFGSKSSVTNLMDRDDFEPNKIDELQDMITEYNTKYDVYRNFEYSIILVDISERRILIVAYHSYKYYLSISDTNGEKDGYYKYNDILGVLNIYGIIK